MTSRLTKALVATGAAAAALALGMTAASAAPPTFTVSAGNATAGTTVQIVGVASGALPRITFTDTTTGTVLNCDTASAPGSTKAGTNKPGNRIGTINGAGTKWGNCTGPLGLQFTVTGVGTWFINATSGSATVVNGSISNVTANVTSAAGCNFTVTGSVPIKYVNSTQLLQVLTTSSDLVLSNVTTSACFGLIANGDHANFGGKYKLTAKTASFNPVSITRP